MVEMRETMPSYEELNAQVLRFMGDGQRHTRVDIKDEVVRRAQLSPTVLEEKLPNGSPRAQYRVGWACSNLFRAGLLERPERAVYQISEAGKLLLPHLSDRLTEKDFEAQPRWQQYLAERRQLQSARGDAAQVVQVLPQTAL